MGAADILGVRQYVQQSYVNGVGGFVHGIAAKDGKVLWTNPLFKAACYDLSPTPIVSGNFVYTTTYISASGCHFFEIQKSDKGFTATDLYSKDTQKVMRNNHGGVVLIDGCIYGYGDSIGWACQDLKTGDLKWSEKEKIQGNYTGAIAGASGQLYVLTDTGEVGMFGADPKEFRELGAFMLPERSSLPKTLATCKDSKPWAHPAVANGRLYVRDHDLIFCFDVKGK
jgi:outer membrane protein assembly factor BamB